ncbi:MAG TPA: VWA domain-containing protein [Pyrinomonadaceae bacterium]|nr:VWA domain-containing protein [Pyrinomonadaceae bacterium]
MNKFFGFFALSLIFVFASSGLVFAQQTTPTAPASEVIRATDVFEVRLPITVLNKKKLPVPGMTKNNFVILENGKPQEVTFFSDEKDNPPVYVGVLMDTSPSTAGKMRFSKEAATNFIYTVMSRRKDKAAFMTFDHEIKLRQDFTDKQDDLRKAVESVKGTGNKTSLYDAIWQFCDEKMRDAKGRRVLVLITDGEDTFSRADLEDAIDIAQRTETTIFAVSTKAGFLGTVPGVEAGTVKDTGDKYLETLAKETGGQAFFTGDMLALERAFTRISNELRTQYIITYKPENQNYDGALRKIEVRLVDKDKADDYRIRTKTGYRAVRDRIR